MIADSNLLGNYIGDYYEIIEIIENRLLSFHISI